MALSKQHTQELALEVDTRDAGYRSGKTFAEKGMTITLKVPTAAFEFPARWMWPMYGICTVVWLVGDCGPWLPSQRAVFYGPPEPQLHGEEQHRKGQDNQLAEGCYW